MPLDEYRRKRKFDATPEPSGTRRARAGREPIFVVQMHDASRLHYDFRLEIKGVLASWAVPKGPSMNPADKRLAMPTEDHPKEYAEFEGIIPEGHYGAGTVMVWDKGTFEIGNGGLAAEELARGELKLILHGCKLKGGFALVRSYGGERSKWLLIKKRDEHADRSWSTAGQDWSVLTGRSMREIAEGAPARRKKAIRSEPARRKAG